MASPVSLPMKEKLQQIEWGLILQSVADRTQNDFKKNEEMLNDLTVATFPLHGLRTELCQQALQSTKIATASFIEQAPRYAPIYSRLIGQIIDDKQLATVLSALIPDSKLDEARRSYLNLLFPDENMGTFQGDLVTKLKTMKWLTPLTLVEGTFRQVCAAIHVEGLLSYEKEPSIAALAIQRCKIGWFRHRNFGGYPVNDNTWDPIYEKESLVLAMPLIRGAGKKMRLGKIEAVHPVLIYQLYLSGYDFGREPKNYNFTLLESIILEIDPSDDDDLSDDRIYQALYSFEIIIASVKPSKDIILSALEQDELIQLYPKIAAKARSNSKLTKAEYSSVSQCKLIAGHVSSTVMDQLSWKEDFKTLANYSS